MDTSKIIFSAILGSFIATLADVIMKENASATGKVAEALEYILEFPVPKLYSMILLILLGVSISLVMGVKDMKKALATGASIVALIMTGIPYETPVTLTSNTQLQGQESSPFIRNAYAGMKSVNSVKVNITINTSDNLNPQWVLITAKALPKRTILGRNKLSGSRYISFSLPTNEFELTIEAPGYTTAVMPFYLNVGNLELNIVLVK